MAWLKEEGEFFWMYEKVKGPDGKWRPKSWSTKIRITPQGRVEARKICADYNSDRARVKNNLPPIAKEALRQEKWWEILKKKLDHHIATGIACKLTRIKFEMVLRFFEKIVQPENLSLAEFNSAGPQDLYKTGRLNGEPGRTYNLKGLVKRPISQATLRMEMAYLSSLFEKALEWGTLSGLEKNHFRRCKSEKDQRRPIPKYLELDSISVFISECRKKYGEDFGILTEFLFYSGARLSEARNALKKAVNLRMNTLTLFGKGNKERVVPILWEPLRKKLEEKLKGGEEGYLFSRPDGSPVPANTIQKRFKEVGSRLGMAWVHPHTMRHSIATHLLNSGKATVKDVQEFLGHENMATTSIYTHAIKGQGMVGAVCLPPAPEIIPMPRAVAA